MANGTYIFPDFNGSLHMDNTSFSTAMDDFNIVCGYRVEFYDVVRLTQGVMGLTLNLVQICVVVCNKKLRENTYTAISCLALADLMYLLFLLITILTVAAVADKRTFQMYPECDAVLNIGSIHTWNDILVVLTSAAYTTSALHMILLSLVRYIVLVHPFAAKAKLTNARVLIVSGLIWMFSLAINFALQQVGGNHSKIMQILIWIINYPFVVVVILIVHYLKIKGLRRLRMTKHKSPQKQMNLFVLGTVIVFTVFPLPWNIVNLMYVFKPDIRLPWKVWFYTGVVLVLNNCINPLIFGFTSPAFRKGLSSLFKLIPCVQHWDLKKRREQTLCQYRTIPGKSTVSHKTHVHLAQLQHKDSCSSTTVTIDETPL